jgi:hypothetical protein
MLNVIGEVLTSPILLIFSMNFMKFPLLYIILLFSLFMTGCEFIAPPSIVDIEIDTSPTPKSISLSDPTLFDLGMIP